MDRYEATNYVTCEGKVSYPSRRIAQEANKRNSRAIRKGRRENLHPYICKKCGQWHLGHPPRKMRYYDKKRTDGTVGDYELFD